MSNDDKSNFGEELEKELQSGMHNTLDESQGQDFTVKVHSEEYVVKRRFYDKEKALETAEDLRKDKRNVVEDNLEGQILMESDGDEAVDWDKLVDAGLQFDPPIAEAAAPKPGDEPVGLTKLPDLPCTNDEESHADVNLEKTFLVKTKVPPVVKEDDTFNLEVEKEVEDIVVEEDEEEDEGAEDAIETESEESPDDEAVNVPSEAADAEEEPEKKKSRSRYTPPVMPPPPKKPSRRKPVLVSVVILAICAAVFFFMQNGKTPSGPAGDSVPAAGDSTVKMPVSVSPEAVSQAKPVLPAQSETAVPATDGKSPAVSEPAAPVASPSVGVVAAAGPLPFAVHSGSYRLPQEAASAVSSFRLKGIAAFSAFVTLPDKGDWYRVYAGCYATLEEASAAASNIKQNFGEDALAVKAPWSIQIGKPVTEAKAAEVASGLSAKGFTSYAVSDPGVPGGSVRIFVGAFTAVKDAGPMADSLKKERFKTAVVRR